MNYHVSNNNKSINLARYIVRTGAKDDVTNRGSKTSLIIPSYVLSIDEERTITVSRRVKFNRSGNA